jgi:thymidylate synthase (FAD)
MNERVEIPGGGSVELLGTFGTDLDVANAARVSMGKQSAEFTDRDARLIRYLATHQHWTPFGQVQARFRLAMPIFLARQWFRHTVGFTRNETSRRYVDEPPFFWRPAAWRERPGGSIKQGSGEPLPPGVQQTCFDLLDAAEEAAARAYLMLLDQNVAPEQARCVLPQSMLTVFVETASLYAYARLWGLRIAEDAQKDLLPFAVATRDLLLPHFPVSIEALG